MPTSLNTICIATRKTDVYSETFIRTHIDKLPFPKTVLCGNDLTITADGDSLLDRNAFTRKLHGVLQRFGKLDYADFQDRRIANYLQLKNVTAVLGEYGMQSSKMAEPCQIAGIPLVAHFHGMDAHLRKKVQQYAKPYARMFEYASAVIGVSTAMCEQLRKLGAKPKTVYHVPYYVDQNQFCQSSPGDQPSTFLAVGRFVEKKAPHLTILAFSKVHEKLPESRLRMIGDGPLLGPCKRLAQALKLGDSVSFEGSQNHTLVAEAMQTCRAFVQHSVEAEDGDSEGTPVAVLEAQASGLPVVATRHTGIADVVLDGQTGFLVEEGDVDQMAKGMLQVAQNPKVAAELGAAGRQRISSAFGYDQTLGKLANIINDCCIHD